MTESRLYCLLVYYRPLARLESHFDRVAQAGDADAQAGTADLEHISSSSHPPLTLRRNTSLISWVIKDIVQLWWLVLAIIFVLF